jgi:hypothetical protein
VEALKPHAAACNRMRREIRRQWKHLSPMKWRDSAIHRPAAAKIGRRVKHLCAIADFHPRRTLTRCAGLAANRRQNRDRNFSCDTTRFFGGADMAAPFAAMGPP